MNINSLSPVYCWFANLFVLFVISCSLNSALSVKGLNFYNSAFAQEQQERVEGRETEVDNSKFYPHNYALSPLGKTDQKPAIKTTQQAGDNAVNAIQPSGQSSQPVSINPLDQYQGKAIESISLIVSGFDFSLIKKCCEIMLRLYNDRLIRTSTVYLIGEASTLPPDDVNELMRRLGLIGVIFDVKLAVPPNFRVTKMPTWIITTAEGDTVLEGLNTPERFINGKAEFIDPKEVAEEEVEGEEEPKVTIPVPKASP